MRKKILFGILFLFSLVLVGCKKDVQVNFVKVEGDNAGLVGESINLSVTILPENAVDKTVTWTSSNPELATVDAGKVNLLGDGRVTITAKVGELEAAHLITISKAEVATTGLSIDGPEEGVEGDVLVLSAGLLPIDATNQDVTWASLDTSIATVDNLGNVVLIKPGEAIIMVSQGILMETHTITVTERIYATTGITISGDEEGEAGQSISLSATVHPSNATNQEVSWSSSDTTLATVNSKGKVTLLKPGIVIIKAYQGDIEMTFEVTINEEVLVADDLLIETEGEIGYVGQELAMLVRVVPENATYKDVTWTSSDQSVAKVKDGKVELLDEGKATITFAHRDVTKTLTLNVYSKLDYIWKLFKDQRKNQITKQAIIHRGTPDVTNSVFPNIFDYMFNDPLDINRDYMLPGTHSTAGVQLHPGRQAPVEWIVVHDTAMTTVDAKALASVQKSSARQASWQYTVGNDGWYQTLEDEDVAWHASAGSTVFGMTDTGIPAINPGERTRLTISSDNYFMIKGIKTDYKVPDFPNPPDGQAQKYQFVKTGIWPIIMNGTYHIPDVRQRNEGSYHNPHIALDGGNENGIGIETSVYRDSDVWVTWSRTAKLVAHLLLKFDLELDRVVYHNSFNNKHCPNTALTSDNNEVWYEMIKFEYMIMKYFSDFEFDFITHTPDFLDNRGRISPRLLKRNFVEYTVKITDADGNFKEEKFRTTAV